MSQPTEGPLWQQGNRSQTLDYLSNLSPQQQANFEKMLNKVPMRDKVSNTIGNAVTRVQGVYDQTSRRLSEAAQSLASQGREYRDAALQAGRDFRDGAVQTGRDLRDDVVQTGRDVRDGARELRDGAVGAYRDGVDRVTDLAQRGQVRADLAWQQGTERLNEVGRNIAQGGRDVRDAVVQGGRDVRGAVAQGGRNAVDGAQRVAGDVSRWFEDRKNHAVTRAEAARATFAAFKHDPTLPGLTPKDLAQLSQQFSQVVAAQTPEARSQAIEAMAEANRVPQTVSQEEARAMSAAMSGVAPAGQGPVVASASASEQGNQGAQTGAVKAAENKKDGLDGR